MCHTYKADTHLVLIIGLTLPIEFNKKKNKIENSQYVDEFRKYIDFNALANTDNKLRSTR